MQRLAILFAVMLMMLGTPARADSWLPPHPYTYLSPNRTYRVRIAPRALTNALNYFQDKRRKREPAGAPKGTTVKTASATVEHLDASGHWLPVWTGALTNEVAPVDALIADNGQFMVTFDNWYSTGYGSNVVAIYDGLGHSVRQLALADLVPLRFIEALPHSVSSIQWRGTPHFSKDGNLVIPIIAPHDDTADIKDGPNYAVDIAALASNDDCHVDAVIRLSDGAVLSGTSPEWQDAIAAAKLVAARLDAYENEANEAFIAPLLGPKANTEPAWHEYLGEAYNRTAPDWKDGSTATTVLRDPHAMDYAASEGWLRDDLLARSYRPDTISIASIAPFDFLLSQMRAILSGAKPGLLKGVQIYVAAPATALPELQSIFAKSGAKVSCFDPSEAIPQRPERIRLRSSRD